MNTIKTTHRENRTLIIRVESNVLVLDDMCMKINKKYLLVIVLHIEKYYN